MSLDSITNGMVCSYHDRFHGAEALFWPLEYKMQGSNPGWSLPQAVFGTSLIPSVTLQRKTPIFPFHYPLLFACPQNSATSILICSTKAPADQTDGKFNISLPFVKLVQNSGKSQLPLVTRINQHCPVSKAKQQCAAIVILWFESEMDEDRFCVFSKAKLCCKDNYVYRLAQNKK